ncbi:39S ribosomal protein L2, mitochondrial [Rhincodon typus]|uniref:39S ribosomal protein L2, mitochondrial n=1 Tax=Rhincodon typus TaxID=259920 RepID=UPI00203025CA|nr:39S ribosomal protein L2, mitochondrial [Rhincodon typus]
MVKLLSHCRSADIALLAGGSRKRWIIATENMEPGDVVKTSGQIGRMAVSANEGDAYPLGALPVGTLLNSLELYPGKGALYIRAADDPARVDSEQLLAGKCTSEQREIFERVIVRVQGQHVPAKVKGGTNQSRELGVSEDVQDRILRDKVLETCVATVGRVSNVDHNKQVIGKAGRNRWLGIRPSSGLWQRKGGWAGRKIRPLPPMKSYVNLPSRGTLS